MRTFLFLLIAILSYNCTPDCYSDVAPREYRDTGYLHVYNGWAGNGIDSLHLPVERAVIDSKAYYYEVGCLGDARKRTLIPLNPYRSNFSKNKSAYKQFEQCK